MTLLLSVERLRSWAEYAMHMLNGFSTLSTLTQGIPVIQNDMDALKPQWDIPELQEEMNQLNEAMSRAKLRLGMLQRVKSFTDDPDPHSCSHTHQRRYTGIFFNSIQVVLCLTCGGWQQERKVIL